MMKNEENLLLNTAFQLEKMNDFPNALLHYEKVLNINKRNYDALIHIALLFIRAKKFQNAFSYIEKAKRVKPNQFKTAYAYFKVYEGDFKFKEALRFAKEMIIINPNNKEGYYSCARTYYQLCDFEKTVEYCDKFLKLEPDNINIQCLKIECLYRTGKIQDIEPMFEELIKKYPDSYTIKRIYTLNLLKNRKWESAMKYYSEVFSPVQIQKDKGKVEQKFIEYDKKMWKRENIEGKTLLISQGPFGLGDFLMFSRYIPQIEKQAKKVIIEANKTFYELFRDNFKNSVIVDDTKEGVNKDDYDYAVTSMNLLYSMNEKIETIPNKNGWLKIADEKIKSAKDTGIFNTDKKKTGIFWRGSGGAMKFRNLDLETLLNSFDSENYQIYSFDIEKKDEKTLQLFEKYNIEDCSKYIETATDTGAFLKNLDLFVTIDSFPVHLAGALGIKTLLILPELSEWRWLEDTNKCIWYDSVHIYRANEQMNIKSVIEDLIEI